MGQFHKKNGRAIDEMSTPTKQEGIWTFIPRLGGWQSGGDRWPVTGLSFFCLVVRYVVAFIIANSSWLDFPIPTLRRVLLITSNPNAKDTSSGYTSVSNTINAFIDGTSKKNGLAFDLINIGLWLIWSYAPWSETACKSTLWDRFFAWRLWIFFFYV